MTNFSILARSHDGEESLQFDGQAGKLTLAPDQEDTLPLTVLTPTRPLWGQRQTIPFRVQVRANHGESEIKVGQLDIMPVFPIWLLMLTGLVAVFLILLLIFFPF